MSEDSFYQKGLMAIEAILSKSKPDVLVLTGGNPDFRDDRQMSIYRLVSYCDQLGQHSLWFQSGKNLDRDLDGHVLPGEKIEIVDLDKILS